VDADAVADREMVAVDWLGAELLALPPRGGVLVITINRPAQRNAVNGEVSLGIAAALDRLDADGDLRVGVLTGAGGSFCSGMDLKAFVTGERPELEGRGFGGLTERSPVKPLIAAVDGLAYGGGFEMVLACDLVVASRRARFALPEVKLGLIPGAGGTQRLPRVLGVEASLRSLARVATSQAHRYALVDLANEVRPVTTL
jgi:enoyl-CoA hydratase